MTQRIALLGAGTHSRGNHGPSLRDYHARHPGAVELVAVCDLDETKAHEYAQDFGFGAVHTDLTRMLVQERLDGIVAVTPMPLTEAIAGQVLEAGVPVVIEKPPGVGVDGTQRLWQVGERTGTRHMVSFNRRFNPALRRGLDWMEQQGHRPRHVVSRMLRRNRLEPDFARDTGLHQVDAVLSVIGRPTRVEGHRESAADSAAANYTGRIESTTGATASLVQTPDVGFTEETMEILGDGFRVWVEALQGELVIEADGERVLSWSAADAGLAEHEANGAYDETAAFVEALATDRPLQPTLADGLVTMRATMALQEGTTVDNLAEDVG